MENTDKYLLTAIRAALEAGREIMAVYDGPQGQWEVEIKADDSPLTRADKNAHHTIAGFLGQTPFPILSEEGKTIPWEERREWNTLWVVDPLDGTKEFIKRNGEFTVNIALVDAGDPVLGVIYVPVTRTLYFGQRQSGAYKTEAIDWQTEIGSLDALKERSERLPAERSDDKYLIVVSRSHLDPATEAFILEKQRTYPRVDTVPCGSSIKIGLVADGSADVYPRLAPTMEWDTAAGDAVCRAAGAVILDWHTRKPLRYNKEHLLNPYFIVEKR